MAIDKGKTSNESGNLQDALQVEIPEEPIFYEPSWYVKTNADEILKTHINALRSVIIIGKPGSGKRSLAWNACMEFNGKSLGDKSCVFRVLTNFDHGIPVHFDARVRTLLLLDGCFERCLIDSALGALYSDLLRNLSEHLSERRLASLVLTVSREEYDMLFSSEEGNSLRRMFEVVDLTDILNDNEKKDMLISHMKITTKNDSAIKSISYDPSACQKLEEGANQAGIGYPLAVDIFATYVKFLCRQSITKRRIKESDVNSYLENPLNAIRNEFNVRHSNALFRKQLFSRVCTVLYTVLKGGILDTHNIDKSLLDQVWMACGGKNPVLNTSHYLLRQKKNQNGVYEILHKSILQVLVARLGERHKELFLSKCDSRLLQKYVRVAEEDRGQDFFFVDTDEHIKILTERFFSDKIDCGAHVIGSDERVRDIWDAQLRRAEPEDNQ